MINYWFTIIAQYRTDALSDEVECKTNMMRKEVPADTDGLNWRKSTASGTGNCVEVAGFDEAVLVRDSKNSSLPPLQFTNAEWTAFLVGTRSGEFDLEKLQP